MENASKALLIAGAILIALATISLVMVIYNSGKDINEDVSKKIDQSILQYHNSQFTIYEKDNLQYSELLKLINNVDNNNNRAKKNIYLVNIELYKEVDETAPEDIYTGNEILNNDYIKKESPLKGEEFKINMIYSENGLINLIKVYVVK